VCREIDARRFVGRAGGRGAKARHRRPTHESPGVFTQRFFRGSGQSRDLLEVEPIGLEGEPLKEVCVVSCLLRGSHRLSPEAAKVKLTPSLFIEHRPTKLAATVFGVDRTEFSLGLLYGVD
jgi:hypothetical protein